MKKQTQILVNRIENLFSLSREPVMGIYEEDIVFCNGAVSTAFERNFVNEKASGVLPEHLLREEAEAFVSSCTILGKQATANCARMGELLVVMLKLESETKPEAVVPPALILALNEAANRLKMSADMVQRYIGAEEDRKLQDYMSALYHGYYSLYRLIHNLESINMLSLGNFSLQQEYWNLVKLCSDLVGTVSGLTAEMGVALRFECEESVLWARVDYKRIEQSILNILTNSFLHTAAGGTITIKLAKMNEAAMISINDTGSGIPPDVIAHIFDRYDRSVSLSALTEGSGFGLNIARGIITLHGGTLMIESQEGRSTSVRIRLPIDVPAEAMDDTSTFKTPLPEPEPDIHVIFRELAVVLSREQYVAKYLDD